MEIGTGNGITGQVVANASKILIENPANNDEDDKVTFRNSVDVWQECANLAKEELVDNVPLQFFCPNSAERVEFPGKAAESAWAAVKDILSSELAIKILRQSKAYRGKGVTLWSTQNDEGAPLVLAETERRAYNLTGGDGQLAVDLGCNLGMITILIARMHPDWRVVCAEAMPVTFLYLTVNLWVNARGAMEAGRIVPLLAALGDGGNVTMQFRADSLTSSRDWNPRKEAGRTTAEFRLATLSLPALLARARAAPPVALLKMDCEGCEYDVVPAMTEEDMAGVRAMVGEAHFGSMKRSGRRVPPTDRVRLTHQRMCDRWGLCERRPNPPAARHRPTGPAPGRAGRRAGPAGAAEGRHWKVLR